MDNLQGNEITFRTPDPESGGWGPIRVGTVIQDSLGTKHDDGWVTVQTKVSWEEKKAEKERTGRYPKDMRIFLIKRQWIKPEGKQSRG